MSIASVIFDGMGGIHTRMAGFVRDGLAAYTGLPEPPAFGWQYQVCTTTSFTGFSFQQGSIPAVVVGDIFIDTDETTPSFYTTQINGDGTIEIFASGDTSRQRVQYGIYRLASNAIDGGPAAPANVWINELGPVWGQSIILTGFVAGSAALTFNLAGNPYATSPEGDALVFALNTGSLPPGSTLAGNGLLSVMSTAIGSFNFTISATDITGTQVLSPASFISVISPFVPPTELRVMAVDSGFYAGVFRTPGDVFDLLSPNDFSDASVNYGPNSATVQYGWMAIVPSTTPLYSWLQSNGSPYLPPQDPDRRLVF